MQNFQNEDDGSDARELFHTISHNDDGLFSRTVFDKSAILKLRWKGKVSKKKKKSKNLLSAKFLTTLN